jgi:hypothetical protein
MYVSVHIHTHTYTCVSRHVVQARVRIGVLTGVLIVVLSPISSSASQFDYINLTKIHHRNPGINVYSFALNLKNMNHTDRNVVCELPHLVVVY